MKYLKKAMTQLGIKYDDETIEQFQTYRELVLSWNEKLNLTAIKDPEDFEIKHFVDSLLCCGYPAFNQAKKMIDVGTGAGFPGMPLAICFPQKEFVLVDSTNKKIKILNEIIETLNLSNVSTIHARAEDLAREKLHRERYDLCLSRAVANLALLSEYCLPFVKVNGHFAAYKALNSEEEIEASHKALQVLGGKLEARTTVAVDGVELNHQILWIKKSKATPANYPRKAGIPVKSPII
jgi:16S rRNA (guanine527-N7)-methyltransferase